MLTRNDCQKLCPLHVINLVQVRSCNCFRDKINLIGIWLNFNLKEIPHFHQRFRALLGLCCQAWRRYCYSSVLMEVLFTWGYIKWYPYLPSEEVREKIMKLRLIDQHRSQAERIHVSEWIKVGVFSCGLFVKIFRGGQIPTKCESV